MDPRHLAYLAVVLDKGSITAAANHLMVTQPTLTRIMSTLEMQAGATLFTRSRYGVKSTPIGEALAREGRSILHTLEIAQTQISRYKLGLQRELRIGIGPMIGLAVMPEIIHRLATHNPELALTITIASPANLPDRLQDGQLDIVIGPAPHNKPIPGIERQLLIEDRVGIFCGRSHPLASTRNDITPEDFKNASWLSLSMANPYDREVIELLTAGGLTKLRTQLVFFNDEAILVKVLEQGQHLAVLPRFPALTISQDNSLVELSLGTKNVLPRNICIQSSEEIAQDPTFQAFCTICKEVAAEFATALPPE